MNNGIDNDKYDTDEAPELKDGCKHCGLDCQLIGFEELCPHYGKKAQDNLSIEDRLKNRIFTIMEAVFEAPEQSHGVAADFSEAELDKFIGTYLDYLSK